MKVAIYCRVSTEEQDNTKQASMCKKFCEIHEHEIHDIYSDIMSGSKASRPEFDRMLKDMRHYKFRAIVITKLDRIGRSLKHLVSLMDEFKAKKVDLIAVTQNIDTTSATGRLQWQIMGAFAEYEREIIRDRTREALALSENRHLVGKRGKDKKPRKKRGVLRK